MKNQFYLVILIVSLALCGAVLFRPNTVDRVLGLVGLQGRTAVTSVAPEWGSMASGIPQADNAFVFASPPAWRDDFADGFAVTGRTQAPSQAPLQPLFGGSGVEPFPQYGNPHSSPYVNATVNAVANPTFDNQTFNNHAFDNHAFHEGVAVSGSNGGVMPGFSGYSYEALSGVNDITIQFGGPASPNVNANPHNHKTQDYPNSDYPSYYETSNVMGFADFTPPQTTPQSVASVGNVGFNSSIPATEASIVMPDPHDDSGFAAYRPRDAVNDAATASALDDRILPPIEAPSVTWGTPVNSPTVGTPALGIAQPIVTPEQMASHNAVIPVQGMVIPTTLGTYPEATVQPISQPTPQLAGTPQFQLQQQSATPQLAVPQFEVPHSAPTMRETPLYVPPSGNAGQIPMAQSAPQLSPQPVSPPLQSPQNTQPVAIASATQHHLPDVDRRAHYEPEVITHIETVFATEVLARVGSGNIILTCDILADVRERLDSEWAMQYRKFYEDYGQKPAVQDERNYKADAMLMLFEETLNSWIVLHTMYLDMTLSVPPEQMDEFKKSLAKDFDSRVLPKVMEQFGVTNRYELNEELRKFGTTLERKKENFLLQNLAEGWFHQRVKPPNQVLNYDDMVSYYEQHKDEKYKVLGTVKWEELAALFPENASEEDAYAKIAALGNRVVQGEPFAEVARQGSQGLSAYRGGERETTVGSLRTPNLEKAVFSLPVGSMSTIIREDMGGINAGYYIVRVLERKDTHYIPFDRVQGEIEKVINGERMKREQERMLAEICNRYPVVKTNNLQQIIHIASEAERNLPVVDTPEYHTQLIAKAERLAPTKKNSANRHTQPSSLQQEPQHIQQQNQEAPRVAWGTNRSDTQNTALPPSWEPNLEPTSRNDDPPKKKTLWQSLNPFR